MPYWPKRVLDMIRLSFFPKGELFRFIKQLQERFSVTIVFADRLVQPFDRSIAINQLYEIFRILPSG